MKFIGRYSDENLYNTPQLPTVFPWKCAESQWIPTVSHYIPTASQGIPSPTHLSMIFPLLPTVLPLRESHAIPRHSHCFPQDSHLALRSVDEVPKTCHPSLVHKNLNMRMGLFCAIQAGAVYPPVTTQRNSLVVHRNFVPLIHTSSLMEITKPTAGTRREI